MSSEQKDRYLNEEDLAFLKEVEQYYAWLRQHPEIIAELNKRREPWTEYFLTRPDVWSEENN